MKNNVYTVNGFLHEVPPVRTVKDFSVQEFVIRTKEDYPQMLKFELTKDQISSLGGIETGQELNVFFSLKGRAWNDKIFHTLRCFRVEPLRAKISGPRPQNTQPTNAKATQQTEQSSSDTVEAEETVF